MRDYLSLGIVDEAPHASRVPRLELLDEFEYSLDAATLVAKDVVVLKNHETREEATQEVRRALTPLGTLEDCRRA